MEGSHGGGDTEYALLNRDQALLLITYMRNNERVRALKKALVKAFSEMERRLQRYEPELTAEQLMAKVFSLLKAGFEHTAKTSYYGLILLQRLEPSTYHPTQRGCVGFSNLSS